MKRIFIKMLPVMAAVLLATSCSKDDGNDAAIDAAIDTPQQTETEVPAVKTVTISGKVGKATLSKVTVAGYEFQFEGNEKFTFGEEGTSDVYGDITINDADGNFTATLNFTDKDQLTSEGGFTAELGNNPKGFPQGLSDPYDALATAVKNAYYVIPFKVAEGSEGTYKLTEGTLSKALSEPTYDVKVYVQAAFIKASGKRTIKLNGSDVTVEADKYYVVPVGAQMGSDEKNTTKEGVVYTVKKLGISYAKTYVGKNVGDGEFTNDITRIGDGNVSYTSDNTAVATIGSTDGKVTIQSVGKATITATLSECSSDCPEETRTATYTLVVAPEDCIPGLFSVASGQQVFFSKGNLQATYKDGTWSWHFAEHQYDCIGANDANTSINGNGSVSTDGTVDLFGWVGGSNTTWTGAAQYGISNSTTTNSDETYGNKSDDKLKSDWGNVIEEGGPWKTLSKEQWEYLLSTRSTDLRKWREFDFGKGLVILPDGCTESIDGEWSTLEAAGAVFLPAAGCRFGSGVDVVGVYGYYWSSSANVEYYAWYLYFYSGLVGPADYGRRYFGQSVRLVRSL